MGYIDFARYVENRIAWENLSDTQILAEVRKPQIIYKEHWVKTATLHYLFDGDRVGEIFAALAELAGNPQFTSAQQWRYRSYINALNGQGINAGDPKTQETLWEFYPTILKTKDEVESILSLGIVSKTYVDISYLGREATVDDITKVRTIIEKSSAISELQQEAIRIQADADNLVADIEAQWNSGNVSVDVPTVAAWKASL